MKDILVARLKENFLNILCYWTSLPHLTLEGISLCHSVFLSWLPSVGSPQVAPQLAFKTHAFSPFCPSTFSSFNHFLSNEVLRLSNKPLFLALPLTWVLFLNWYYIISRTSAHTYMPVIPKYIYLKLKWMLWAPKSLYLIVHSYLQLDVRRAS